MKQAYTESLHLSKANIERLNVINDIIEEYRQQGYKLTLRQLYYQLVSRDIIANKVQEYAALSGILVKGRMAGIVDWDAIEDRIRIPKIPYSADDIADALDDLIGQYRRDRMCNQEVYIEVWVEKDALSGVISRITNKYHVRLMVNRGYSSATAMHDAAMRILHASACGQEAFILYLGDHDPSGMDMVRDIRDRLLEFGADVTVKAIALTDEQIAKYNPPPNPAKIADPRATTYIEKYGPTSWEVDALKPNVLNSLVESNIKMLIDMEKFNEMKTLESHDIRKLTAFKEKQEQEENENEDNDDE